MRLVNADRTRLISDEPLFGIACYQLYRDPDDDKHWMGLHVGTVGELTQAEAWLEGDDSVPVHACSFGLE